MKQLTMLIVAIFLLVSPISVASGDTTSPNTQLGISEWSQTTADDHLTTAQTLEQKVSILEAKIIKMAERVTEFERKPYLDTKGFRRDSLKRIIGSTLKEIKDLQNRIAWHRTEASRLAEVNEPVHDGSDNGKNGSQEGNTSSS
ncbi:MAG: hypothetical protein R3351_03360 [Nitrospirales bacterium]|nr:hypothetical protein [Nitrospirales bacterium]